MKTLVVLLFIVASTLLYFVCYSQNQKGDILLAVYADPLVSRRTIASPPNFASNPLNIRTHVKGGYHLFNRFALGASLSYNHFSGRSTDFNARYHSREQLAGVYARYMLPIRKFGLLVEGGYGLGKVVARIPESVNYVTKEYTEVSINSGVQVYHYAFGINYRLNRTWLIEAMARQETGRYNQTVLSNNYPLHYINGGFFIGAVYFISRKE